MNFKINIFNTISRQKEELKTITQNELKMYVCGPTVYDRPHLGNARSIVIYDLFYRFFLTLFNKVTYVRNITDVDDKINIEALNQNISIQELTNKIIKLFNDDTSALQVLKPSFEPKATENIAEMIEIIQKLIEKKHAYISEGHVLFDVTSYKDYGKLSNRNLEEMIVGSRIEVGSYKKNPLDFVLWKPASKNDDKSSMFESPWNFEGSNLGRPGWHIECSAMSAKYLGNNFDIHGGGADLQFPHHENEIAQSVCANENSFYAKYWIHNGFLTVEGEKMSKSLKNFITVRDLLDKDVKGVVIRYLLLATHYRKPFDYNEKALLDATKTIEKFNSILLPEDILDLSDNFEKEDLSKYKKDGLFFKVLEFLADDLNISKVIALLHDFAKKSKNNVYVQDRKEFAKVLNLLGFIDKDFGNYVKNDDVDVEIENLINQRIIAKQSKDFALADKIRNELLEKGIILEDVAKDKTIWKKS